MTQQSDPVPQEILDWRNDLNNPKDIEITLQEILKAMSNGFDVSPLFADMLKLMTIKDVKLKKLIYIYLTSNAKVNAQYAILLVNALVFDTANESALIRSLALRTMAAVAIPEVAESFAEQFVKFSTDADPFVRKTVCTGIAKLYKIAKQTCYDLNLIVLLHKMIYDGNQTVVSAAVGALISIVEMPDSDEKQPVFSGEEADQLLTALAYSNEWSAHTILYGLSQYTQITDVEVAVARIQPFLKHGNPAVALNAVNLLIKLGAAQMVSQSLLSLVSQAQSSEIQFVAMRSLRLASDLIDKNEFKRNIKNFYVRFNDELYIKLEKIEILSGLATQETVADVIYELQEYCQDVNDSIVRASLKAISKIAVLIPIAADLCVQTYLLLLTGEFKDKKSSFKLPSYAAYELMVCIQNIFRYYPNRYEGIIGDLCDAIYNYDDYKAKASLIWILGEYADRIDEVEVVIKELLDLEASFDGLKNEHALVQLACVTAVAKIHLSHYKDTTQRLFHGVIDLLQQSDEPGVRQRAKYISKLFKLDPTLSFAKSVLYVQKSIPVYNDGISPILKAKLYCRLGSVPATLRELVSTQYAADNNAEEIIEQFENYEYVESAYPPAHQIGPEDVQQQAPQQTQQPMYPMQYEQLLDNVLGQVNYNNVYNAYSNNIIDDLLGYNFAAPAAPTQQATISLPQPPAHSNMPQAPVFSTIPTAPQPVFNPVSQPMARSVTQPPTIETYQLSQGQPMQQPYFYAYPMPQANFSVETPHDVYPFYNLPCRAKETTYPLQILIGLVRVNGNPQLQLIMKNISSQPISSPKLQFAPNAFGIYAADLGIPIIPALNNYNGGNPVPVSLFLGQPSGPLVGKTGQADPKMQSNLNVLTFTISQAGGQDFMFQMKMPLAVLFQENSPWHRDRILADPGAAQYALNQTKQWSEFTEHALIQGDMFQSMVQATCYNLQRANMLLINFSAELGDFVCCFQALGVSVMCFVRVFWSYTQSGTQFNVVVKVPQNAIIFGAFVAANVVQVINRK